LLEHNEDDKSNLILLDEDREVNISLVSSLSLPSPAFSAASSDKGKTPVYHSNTNKNTNSNGSSRTSNNINKAPYKSSNARVDDISNESGLTAASYIWRHARKQQMPSGQEHIFCLQAQCKSHTGWIATGGGTGNVRRHLQSVYGLYDKPPPTAGEGPLPALFVNQASRARPSYNPSIMHNLMVRMVVRHKLPFTIFGSAEVQAVIKYAASTMPDPEKIFFPSDSTIANDISKIYILKLKGAWNE
jgi:hypothetical protein